MFTWNLIFSWRFWFSVGWNPLQPKTAILMFVVFTILFVVGVLLWVAPRRLAKVDPPLRRALERGGNVAFTTGLLGIFFTFTAFEQASFLAGRFWFLAILLLFLGWGGWTVWRAHILVPAEREAKAIKERFERYLPKSKNSK